jgi:hypothetical protein
MGCCQSSEEGGSNASAQPINTLAFSNKQSKPIGDENIPPSKRVVFGIVYPEETNARSVWMYFNVDKPVEALIVSAAGQAGLRLDKGKLLGSPQRLNLFTLEGDTVRLDLEIDAHMGRTLHVGDVLVLEKGNRMESSRLEAIKSMHAR